MDNLIDKGGDGTPVDGRGEDGMDGGGCGDGTPVDGGEDGMDGGGNGMDGGEDGMDGSGGRTPVGVDVDSSPAYDSAEDESDRENWDIGNRDIRDE